MEGGKGPRELLLLGSCMWVHPERDAGRLVHKSNQEPPAKPQRTEINSTQVLSIASESLGEERRSTGTGVESFFPLSPFPPPLLLNLACSN